MKNKLDLAFVILHYMTDCDTIDCINSIFKFVGTEKYKIIVVDNASNNGSVEKIREAFKNNTFVDIIENKENLGFSKGLNVGISYVNDNFDADFIALINNDTLLLQNDFFNIINKKYSEYKFSVLGPMIVTNDAICNINPIRNTIRSDKEALDAIKRYEKLLKICNYKCFPIYKYISNFKSIFKKTKQSNCKYALNEAIDFKLHGCFFVLSKEYFSKFNGLDPSTFLYGEEDILYLHLMKNNMHTLYTPDIVIFHKEYSSTDNVNTNSTNKQKFIAQECIKSLRIYIDLYRNYK